MARKARIYCKVGHSKEPYCPQIASGTILKFKLFALHICSIVESNFFSLGPVVEKESVGRKQRISYKRGFPQSHVRLSTRQDADEPTNTV